MKKHLHVKSFFYHIKFTAIVSDWEMNFIEISLHDI